MRIDFNILWIEDQQHYVLAQKTRISSLLKREGFQLDVQFKDSAEQALEILSDDIFADHVDLVLVDYDLGAGMTGDAGIVAIREIMPFKEIVFYSAQARDLRQIIRTADVQGIYSSTRDDLPDTVYGIFETLIKKVLDIDHSRGVVMGATSDIDQIVNDCLVSIFERCLLEDGTELKASALKIVSKRAKDLERESLKNIEKLKSIDNLTEIFDLHRIYTSNDRIILLKKLLGELEIYTEACISINDYVNETIPKRNTLAHVNVSKNGFARKLHYKDGTEITSEDMRSIRLELLRHRDQLETLLSSLQNS